MRYSPSSIAKKYYALSKTRQDRERTANIMNFQKIINILSDAKLWSAATLFGGLIFVIYFYDIAYMPELDIMSLSALVFAAVFAGMFVIIILSAAFVLPSIIWSGWLSFTGESIYKKLNFATEDSKGTGKI